MRLQFSHNRWLAGFLLLVCCIPLFFLNINTVHTPGGDDYAQYIKEAKNIAEGKPYYQSNYVFNKYNNSYSPPQYPPGFPLLLSPVVKYCGIEIKPICYFNTVIAVILCLTFFVFFRKYAGAIAALCMSLLVTYSGIMIDLKQNALSDGTCLLFVMLYLAARNAKTFPWTRIVVLILFASMAILIRTQAILLVPAEVTFLLISLIRDWLKQKTFSVKAIATHPSLHISFGTVLLTLFMQKVVFPSPHTASGFYADFLGHTLHKGLFTIIRDNINFFLDTIRSFFHYETQNSVRTAMVTVMESSGLVLCLSGCALSLSKRLSFDDIFFLFSCGLMLYYPIHDARYFLPAIAIVYYYCYTTLTKIIPAATKIKPRYLSIALTLICLFAGLKQLSDATKPPLGYVPELADKQAFEYIRQQVNDTDIILCARPRLVTLYTDKKCMVFAWQRTPGENKKILDSMQVRYALMMHEIAGEYLHTFLNQQLHPIDSTSIAKGYVLYTLRK